ncbi:MAG: hypothetical protein PGN33_15795 [Methylobacterium radiotolerans]
MTQGSATSEGAAPLDRFAALAKTMGRLFPLGEAIRKVLWAGRACSRSAAEQPFHAAAEPPYRMRSAVTAGTLYRGGPIG